MAAGKSSRINRQYKTKYRIRNWREYERGLRSRGDVTIWLSEDAIAAWIPPKNGLRGGVHCGGRTHSVQPGRRLHTP